MTAGPVPAVTARPLRSTELRRAAETLAAGFLTDPVMAHVLPDGGRRFEQLRDLFTLVVEHGGLVDGTVWCDEEVRCVAHWTGPGAQAATDQRMAARIDAFAAAVGDRLAELGRMEAAMAAAHPTEPHWYLGAVATEPTHQGRGLATAVLGPVLGRGDDDGVGAYLESSNEANIPLYRRLGFEVVGTIRPWGDDGPSLWPMWRDPVAP